MDAAIVRAATHSSTIDVAWPDLRDGGSAQVAAWSDWLRMVWARESFAGAVEQASPVLAERIRAVCSGREQRERQVRRIVHSTMRYLLRARSRATPFGLFAGVAPVRFGPETRAHYGADHRATSRVDSEWLAKTITDLEHCHELMERLHVAANNQCRVRHGRLELEPRQARDSAAGNEPDTVSLRMSRATEVVMAAAASSICYEKLAGTLRFAFPQVLESTIVGLLADLIGHSMLITNLRPPMTATDPLGYVVTELTKINAEDVAPVAPTVRALAELHANLPHYNAASMRGSRVGTGWLASVAAIHQPPLGADTRIDLDLVLAPVVVREAERAASTLARLTPDAFGKPALRDYHGRFLERYGVGGAVAVNDLLDPTTGLGYPAGYRGSPYKPPSRAPSERDTILLEVAQNAAIDRSIEVDLDDDTLAALDTNEQNKAHRQPHTELSFQIYARDRTAIDRGDFDLAVLGLFRAAGTTIGRFLNSLPAEDQHRIADTYTRLPTITAGALPVQLSSPPLYASTENIARTHPILPTMISLGEHRAPGDDLVAVDDLAVVGDTQRLFLWSLSRGQVVEPALFSAVELTTRTHPLARFLCEISTARAATCRPFTWGLAGELPFLPRLRHGRTILSPVRWTFHKRDLPDRTASWRTWVQGLTRWRNRVLLPDAVHLGANDQRIRLDLDEPAHLHLLRTELDRRGRITLIDGPDNDSLGWIDGRAHEIVVPLASTQTPFPAPARPAAIHLHRANDEHPPGDCTWLYAKIHAHPDQHTAILAALPEMLSTWDEPPQWWFLPYRDPDDHIRLRLPLPDIDAYGRAARRVGSWTTRLRSLGLCGRLQLDTYVAETGRFGTDDAMTAAEAVFAADSACALAQRQAGNTVHPHAVAALSMLDLTTSFLEPTTDATRWLIDAIAKTSSPAPDRHIHQQVVRLATPGAQSTHLCADVTEAWSRRRAALLTYRDTLAAPDQPDPHAVVRSLLHLHSLRATGLSPDIERACLRLARIAALSLTVRTGEPQ